MDVRESAHERMEQELSRLAPQIPRAPIKPVEPVGLEEHHRIAKDESNKLYFGDWLSSNANDPAFKVCFNLFRFFLP